MDLTDLLTWLGSFWDDLTDLFDYVLAYIQGFFISIAYKLYGLLSDGWNWLVNKYTDITNSFYESLINADFIGGFMDSISGSGLGYFWDYFGCSALISATVSGYFVRFAIRRLPVIG